MGVVVDVVCAVAVVALATGAVSEFQLRIGNIRSSANGAAVSVGVLLLRFCGLVIGLTGEGDDLCFFGLFVHCTLSLDAP